nr:MAG TPA: hypothetical protein [Bacteriophage sp.]
MKLTGGYGLLTLMVVTLPLLTIKEKTTRRWLKLIECNAVNSEVFAQPTFLLHQIFKYFMRGYRVVTNVSFAMGILREVLSRDCIICIPGKKPVLLCHTHLLCTDKYCALSKPLYGMASVMLTANTAFECSPASSLLAR